MAGFSTYATIQASIADWLNRADLTGQIVDFITLAEVKIARKLRYNVSVSQFTISSEATTFSSAVTAPALAEARVVWLSTGSPDLDRPLTVVSPGMLEEIRAGLGGVAGRPRYAAIYGGKLHVAPAPDQSYTANVVYFDGLNPLSTTNVSNSQLLIAPDAYLYGALLEAERFLENDDRIPMWQAGFDDAIQSLNDLRDREEFGANNKPIRLPINFS